MPSGGACQGSWEADWVSGLVLELISRPRKRERREMVHKNKLNIIDNCKVVHKQTLSMVRHTLSPLHGKLGTDLMAELLEAVTVTLSATQIQCSLTQGIYQSLCIIQHNYQHTTGFAVIQALLWTHPDSLRAGVSSECVSKVQLATLCTLQDQI